MEASCKTVEAGEWKEKQKHFKKFIKSAELF